MYVVRKVREVVTRPRLEAMLRSYGLPRGDVGAGPQWEWDLERRGAWQLRAFNALWAGYAERVPYYKGLVDGGKAPRAFGSWEEFRESVPVSTKELIRESVGAMTDPARPAERKRVTGGSTGHPMHLPAWFSESALGNDAKAVGRLWYGITLADRKLLIWGHSHAMGAGFAGWKNKQKREWRDRLLGQERVSAYTLDVAAARRAMDVLVRTRPGWLVGYSGAIEALARINEDRAEEARRAGLKGVLCSAEVFPTEAGPDIVRRVLGCRLMMEYGSIETDIMAHTAPDLDPGHGVPGYRAFWQLYFLEVGEPVASGGRPLYVTSLTPRCFPLVRYRIGDEMELYEGDAAWSIARFRFVRGTQTTYVDIPGIGRIHPMMMKHVVDNRPEVARFQFVQLAEGMELRVVLRPQFDPGLRQEIEANIRQRASAVHEHFPRTLRVTFDAPPLTTPAGKTPMIYDEARYGKGRAAAHV